MSNPGGKDGQMDGWREGKGREEKGYNVRNPNGNTGHMSCLTPVLEVYMSK